MYVTNNLTKYVVSEGLTAGQLNLKCLQSNSTFSFSRRLCSVKRSKPKEIKLNTTVQYTRSR